MTYAATARICVSNIISTELNCFKFMLHYIYHTSEIQLLSMKMNELLQDYYPLFASKRALYYISFTRRKPERKLQESWKSYHLTDKLNLISGLLVL